MTPKNGHTGAFAFILTHEIADYIQGRPVAEAMKGLGVSEYTVCKFRKIIGCQYPYPKSYPFEWILEHQEDIIYMSFEALEQKYGLTHAQVENYTRRLLKHGIIRRHHQRKTVLDVEKEQWFKTHKQNISQLDRKGIQQVFNVKQHTAKRLHDLACREKNILTTSEKWKQHVQNKRQWMLDHQEELLSIDHSLDEIAQKFGVDKLFIRECRVQLRKLTKTSFTEYKLKWILKNQHDLENLSMDKLKKKLNRGAYAIRNYQKILKNWKNKECD